MERLEGVDRADVDWKGKQAEVFGSEDGFDPAELPDAVRRAGFVPQDADVGLDVTVVGRLVSDAGQLSLVLPTARWQLVGGEGLASLSAVEDTSGEFRLKGAFAAPDESRSAKLSVASWERLGDE